MRALTTLSVVCCYTTRVHAAWPMDSNATIHDVWSNTLLRLEFQIDSLRSIPTVGIVVVVICAVSLMLILCACSCIMMMATESCADRLRRPRLLGRDRQTSEMDVYDDQVDSVTGVSSTVGDKQSDPGSGDGACRKARSVKFRHLDAGRRSDAVGEDEDQI